MKRQAHTTRREMRGLTAVEMAIATVILAVIVAAAIAIVKERRRLVVQADADANPAEYFRIAARAAKDTFSMEEPVVVLIEIFNQTSAPLDFKWKFALMAGDTSWSGLGWRRGPNTRVQESDGVLPIQMTRIPAGGHTTITLHAQTAHTELLSADTAKTITTSVEIRTHLDRSDTNGRGHFMRTNPFTFTIEP